MLLIRTPTNDIEFAFLSYKCFNLPKKILIRMRHTLCNDVALFQYEVKRICILRIKSSWQLLASTFIANTVFKGLKIAST